VTDVPEPLTELPPIVLASASPRRRQLLEACGLSLTVAVPAIDETPRPREPPDALVRRLAREKAAEIARRHARSGPDGPPVPVLVVAADTEVVLDRAVLGKPTDPADAERMLRALSGRRHEVLTGFAIAAVGESRHTATTDGVVATTVVFRALTDAEIAAYVATGEPLDKAGAYGIQGGGGALVDTVSGSYSNVVGLPIAEVLDAMHTIARILRRA
jgi:septum formation protein